MGISDFNSDGINDLIFYNNKNHQINVQLLSGTNVVNSKIQSALLDN